MDTLDAIPKKAVTCPSREMLIQRAELLIPVLADRSDICESSRSCPSESIEDFVEAGFLKICQPSRYGGYDLGYDVLCEVIEVLARGCGSQAWVAMVLADNALKFSAFPIDAQDDVWKVNANAKLCISLAPVGQGNIVDGGMIWNGRHSFSSGIDHADWVMCGGHVTDNAAPRSCFALVSTRDITVMDDWHVMGLAGTGSKSFEVKDIFIPDHHFIDKRSFDEGRAPGTTFYCAPIAKLVRGGVTAASYAAVAVGVAAGFLENYYRYAAQRKSHGAIVADDAGVQIDVACSSAELEAARSLYMESVRETMRILQRGDDVTPLMQAHGKRNAAFACQLAMSAVQRLFNAAGGPALYSTGPTSAMQRQFRDVFAASAHYSVVWKTAAAGYGRQLLQQYGSAQ